MNYTESGGDDEGFERSQTNPGTEFHLEYRLSCSWPGADKGNEEIKAKLVKPLSIQIQ